MKRQFIVHTIAAAGAVGLCLAVPIKQAQAGGLGLSNTPLTVRTGVSPNLIITLDDSGSMDRDYVPDGTSTGQIEHYSPHYNGMAYDPAVEYPAPVDASGNEIANSYPNAWKDGFDRGSTANLTHNYYAIFDASNINCGGGERENDCYDKVYVNTLTSSQQQNYANWYSFYRTRRLTTLTGLSLAFRNIDDEMRVGWQGLNRDTTITTLRELSGTHRSNFYGWLESMYANNGTPLRKAMKRAGTRYGKARPYYNDPDDASAGSAACRQNYQILMTDGIWNGGKPSHISKADDQSHTLPDGESYTPTAPYQDGDNDLTVADLAFHYWHTDLRPTLANDLPKFMPTLSGTDQQNYWNPRNDPANWQHMVTYTVGLGLTYSLNESNRVWGGSTYAGDFANLEDGSQSWPGVGSGDNDNPYDLWHAAINSRGQFFSADDPKALADAFKTILERIAERTASNTATAAQSGDARTGDSVYETQYNSRDWNGELISYKLNDDATKGNIRWAAGCALTGGTCAADSRNYTGMAPNDRRIVAWNPTSGSGGDTVPFRWSKLSTAQRTALNKVDSLGQQRLLYLRGERSNEKKNGGTLRDRASVLGDIAHSTPEFVGAPKEYYDDFSNGLSEAEQNSYATFKSNNASRGPMIYAGANDGMLHAFYAGHTNTYSGQEAFAFIPSAVLPHLPDYTAPDYAHRSYVDAPPVSGDAYFGSQWHTVLAGGLRHGGQAVYALDITSVPDTSSTESTIADKVLWQFSDQDDAELGYTYGKPQIVRLHNGKWAAVFGNGYNNTTTDGHASTSGNAVLYIVSLSDGSLIRKIDTGVGTSEDPTGNARPNGLATPALADIDGDMVYDYAYAGDLFGNLWKFDLSSGTASTWDVAYQAGSTKKPLFQAVKGGHHQSITAAPAVRAHPSGEGSLILFGTGKYIEGSDAIAKTTIDSMYGIWDRDLHNASGAQVYVPFTRDHLLEQAITHEVTLQPSGKGRLVSNNAMDWYDANSASTPTASQNEYLGWYLDLKLASGTAKGEMVTHKPVLYGDRVVINTLTPNDDPCSSGASGFLMALNASDGGPPKDPVLDADGDNQIDSGDVLDPDGNGNPLPLAGIGGINTPGVPGVPPTIIDTGSDDPSRVHTGGGGGDPMAPPRQPLNRTSWHEIR